MERISRDLEAVGMKKDLMNARMISDIVSKLPPVIAQEWAKYKVNNKATYLYGVLSVYYGLY